MLFPFSSRVGIIFLVKLESYFLESKSYFERFSLFSFPTSLKFLLWLFSVTNFASTYLCCVIDSISTPKNHVINQNAINNIKSTKITFSKNADWAALNLVRSLIFCATLKSGSFSSDHWHSIDLPGIFGRSANIFSSAGWTLTGLGIPDTIKLIMVGGHGYNSFSLH